MLRCIDPAISHSGELGGVFRCSCFILQWARDAGVLQSSTDLMQYPVIQKASKLLYKTYAAMVLLVRECAPHP